MTATDALPNGLEPGVDQTGVPPGYVRVSGYEPCGPPVPGVGPVRSVVWDFSHGGIVAIRFADGNAAGDAYVLRDGAIDWELLPATDNGETA